MSRNRKDIAGIVNELLAKKGSFHTSEVAQAAGLSRQAVHRKLNELVRSGVLIREGAGRGARYRREIRAERFVYPRAGLAEDLVWRDVRRSATFPSVSDNVERILHYALSELVNNAIDHSESAGVEVIVPPPSPRIQFEILDEGVGIFDHLSRKLALPDRMTALQELSKGKVTTDPARHTGEGIFFVSKIADYFEIDSGGIAWKVDNLRGDFAVGAMPPRKGTRVRFEIDPKASRTLAALFEEFTENYEFSKTRIVVKLFEIGTRFISRSEAKRLLHGLERFRDVVLDFAGVTDVGQGFADEVFRVWPVAHPETRLRPIAMIPEVEFMIERARRAR